MNATVSVIRSKCPGKDAAVLSRLCPHLSQSEETMNSAVLYANEDASTQGTITLVFVPGEPNNEQFPILVLSPDQIRVAQTQCGGDGVDLLYSKTVKILNGPSTLVKIRLQGGGFILFVSPTLASSAEGRQLLVQALISPDSIEESVNMDVGVGKSVSNLAEISNGKIMSGGKADPPKFPSLAVSILAQNGRIQPNFPVNSQDAVPVETDLFVGRLMLTLRPPNPSDDPYWNERVFATKKRRFLFQLQGKFKYAPTGTVYAGAEVSDIMKLGLVAKGLCGILLRLVNQFNSNMHYSFGDSKDQEKPHIVVPAWTFFERLVVTKPGEIPPELGEEFPESKASIASRKSSNGMGTWNTDDTYSMSFYSMYIDIPHWRIVQLPVTRDIDLRTFWGNSFLSIVLYEKTNTDADEKHLQRNNKYFFAIQMKYLGFPPEGQSVEETGDNEMLPWGNTNPMGNSKRIRYLQDRQESGIMVGESDGEEYFFDAEEENLNDSGEDIAELVNESSRSTVSSELLSSIDSLCPAWIEMCQKGKYTKVYAFNLEKEGKTVFRTFSTFEEYFDSDYAIQGADEMWSSRLSSAERTRRILGQSFSYSLAHGTASTLGRISEFKKLRTPFDAKFLQRPAQTMTTKSVTTRKSGFVARALSDRHWIEEWVRISDQHVSFYNPEKEKLHFQLRLQTVVKVGRLSRDRSPHLSSYSFLEIETLGRTVYLMFASDAECDDWVEILTRRPTSKNPFDQTISVDVACKGSIASEPLMVVDDPTDEFLHKSSLWNCKQRRILNCRKFSFHSKFFRNGNAHTLVEDALVRALEPREEAEECNLRGFLNSASALKDADVQHMGESERLAFFLNLYHVMIMHAFLVLGTPDSSFKWISYFSTISYQCSDDVFSLTELEHCIIRAAMNYPSQFVAKFVLPKSQYRFALTQPDYRINFALNCGSMSNPGVVPVYKTSSLNQQLDDATRLYLNSTVEVSLNMKRFNTVVITLPRVCQWFTDDFGNGSIGDILVRIEKFLDDDKRRILAKCYSVKLQRFNVCDLQVKHHPYSFECRHLTLQVYPSA